MHFLLVMDGIPLNAARIVLQWKEDAITIDRLPESAFVRTFSEDGQVTDSAPSMAAYMTGVKMKNEVISMQTGTVATPPNSNGTSNCDSAADNKDKKPAETLLELAKSKGMGTGIVTTTRVTHATPATTYAHVCHRDAENDIAAQLVPGGKGTDNLNLPTAGGKRADGRDLIQEMQKQGYNFVANGTDFAKVDPSKTQKLLGLFNSSHLNYDLDRVNKKIDEPSLADLTSKAIDVLQAKNKSFFLMVEGGRIDHALHDTNAKRGLQDTVAFDNAIKTAIEKMKKTDPELKEYIDRKYVKGGETSVLGLVKNYNGEGVATDINGNPYAIIGFGTGKKRLDFDRKEPRGVLVDNDICNPVKGPVGNYKDSLGTDISTVGWCTGVASDDFQQEAVVQTGFADDETHGGTDVFLGAIGAGSENFYGSLENTEVFQRIRKAIGL
ncbi:hypothetical protein FQR65_LT17900 [Abscondita terminalis]|nr:hypothetical protein FQR65_LT17900 [Abscondita terminalis]